MKPYSGSCTILTVALVAVTATGAQPEPKELIAEVLPENAAMRKVFGKFGFQTRRGGDPGVVHLALTL